MKPYSYSPSPFKPQSKGRLERLESVRPPHRAALNAAALSKLVLMENAIESLDREGHTVIGVDLSIGKPTIQLEATGRLAGMADGGQAAYYMRGVGADGLAYRKGTLLAYRNINVVWFERGH